MSKITLIGTGMMGCSFGQNLRKKGHFVVGYDISSNHLEQALEIGAVDAICHSLNKSIADTDVVMVFIPVDVIANTLPYILDNTADETIVIDAGSTKRLICEKVKNHPRRQSFVATHPMAGNEFTGPSGSNPHLLVGRTVAICDVELSSRSAVAITLEILEQIGMHPITISSAEHDAIAALVSHIPQLLSYAYTAITDFNELNPSRWEHFASSGFDSISRISASSSRMWLPIIEQNKSNILRILAHLKTSIDSFARCIEDGNEEQIKRTIERSNKTRARFELKKNQLKGITHQQLNQISI